MIPASVIVVTKNAEAQLAACLDAAKDFAEVIVVDSYSTDLTCKIAVERGAQLVLYKWNGAYPKKRQWCLDTLYLKYDWVLFLDADEILTDALKKDIETALQSNITNMAGYFIKGRYVWSGIALKYGLCNAKIALFDRKKMHFPVINDLGCSGMGEIEGHYQPVLKVKGSKIGKFSSYLHHVANFEPKKWQERHQRYAAWEVCMTNKGAWPEDPVPWRQLLKQALRRNFFRPELAFLHSYVFKLGCLDGRVGWSLAVSRWHYYQMIRFPRKYLTKAQKSL